MKNILITEDCFVKGQPAEKGTILKNVDNSTAADLLSSGRAKIYTGEPVKTEEPKKKAAKKKSAKKAD